MGGPAGRLPAGAGPAIRGIVKVSGVVLGLDGGGADDDFGAHRFQEIDFFLRLLVGDGEDGFVAADGGDERQPTASPGLSKDETLAYAAICRQKLSEVIAAETAARYLEEGRAEDLAAVRDFLASHAYSYEKNDVGGFLAAAEMATAFDWAYNGLAPAERSTGCRLDNADSLDRQAEGERAEAALLVYPLPAGVDREEPAVPAGDATRGRRSGPERDGDRARAAQRGPVVDAKRMLFRRARGNAKRRGQNRQSQSSKSFHH